MNNETQHYVDNGMTQDGLMVQVLTIHGAEGKANIFRQDHTKVKARKLTIKERFCNWLIIRLGGELKSKYTRFYPSGYTGMTQFMDDRPNQGVVALNRRNE